MLTAGRAVPDDSCDRLLDFGAHLALPLATVSLGLIGQYSILMRSSIIETLSEDYVTTARAKGLSDGRVLRHHALPNALLPTVTLIAINLGYVVAGAITVEVVFNWPGLGTLTVEALTARDYPVLQGVFLLLSVSVVLANLRRRPRLRRPRPAGAGMTASRLQSPGRRGPTPVRRVAGRSGAGSSAGRRASSGWLILLLFAVLAIAPELFVGPLADGHDRDRRRALAAVRPTSCSGPTSSAATCST